VSEWSPDRKAMPSKSGCLVRSAYSSIEGDARTRLVAGGQPLPSEHAHSVMILGFSPTNW